MSIQSGENPRNGRLHLWQQEWIAERIETRPQKSFDFFCAAKSFSRKQLRDAFGSANFSPSNRAAIEIIKRCQDPSVLHRASYSQTTL
jgi:hypothetical protein